MRNKRTTKPTRMWAYANYGRIWGVATTRVGAFGQLVELMKYPWEEPEVAYAKVRESVRKGEFSIFPVLVMREQQKERRGAHQ